MTLHTAYISVGSNLGEKLANCRNGIAGLSASGLAEIGSLSPFYRTEPVDFTDQHWFVNAVVMVRTGHRPQRLLDELKTIQRRAGRLKDPVRFGPRVLDLDIILFDKLIMDTPDLVIPHPRMHKRRFVLQPMCDIDSTILHPVLKLSMKELLQQLPGGQQEVRRIDA